MSTKPPSRVVFVGNIPYGKPSNQLVKETIMPCSPYSPSQDFQKSRLVNSSAAQVKSLTFALSTIEILAAQRALVSPNIQTQVSEIHVQTASVFIDSMPFSIQLTFTISDQTLPLPPSAI